MFRAAPVENLFVSLKPYEQQLIRFLPDAPPPTANGLTWADIDSLHVIRPITVWLFGSRYGSVGIEDNRHPKHREWELYRVSCKNFLSRKRKLVLLEQRRQREREEFWRGLCGHDFEKEFARMLEGRGYRVSHVGGPGDSGVDLLLDTKKGRVIVQCKAHAGRIGPAAVRDLFGSLLHNGAREAWLVSVEGFSSAAREFAAGKPIRLLTIDAFLHK